MATEAELIWDRAGRASLSGRSSTRRGADSGSRRSATFAGNGTEATCSWCVGGDDDSDT